MSVNSQKLIQLFREEHALLARLAALLEKEFAAARAGDDPETLLEEKQALVTELDRATARRLAWLEGKNLPTHGADLRRAIADFDDSDALIDLFQRFEADAVACRDRNRQLGQFNIRRQQSLQEALRIFAHQSVSETNDYTAQGQTDVKQKTRLLGSA